ncbi:MAG: pyridoxamine 5'-phosphate oxidase family protein [Phycisphaeraceae bacterium]
MCDESISTSLRRFLGEHSTLSLCTLDPSGRPHAANVYFAPDEELNLFFVSDPRSLHSRCIAGDPRVAGTVYAPVQMWQQIRGVQFHGSCAMIDPGEYAIVWKIYLDQFPHIHEVESLVRSQQFYRIRPDWFRYTDNAVHFGHKVETAWPPMAVGK